MRVAICYILMHTEFLRSSFLCYWLGFACSLSPRMYWTGAGVGVAPQRILGRRPKPMYGRRGATSHSSHAA